MSLVKKRLAQRQITHEKTAVATEVAQAVKPEQSPTARPDIMADFEMYQIALEADLAQLKQFSKVEDKADYKAKALEINDYLKYVDSYVESGANHPNNVLAWVVIWLVDLKRWDKALKLLPILQQQNQPLPTRFNTKAWPDFFIDQMYDIGRIELDKEEAEKPNTKVHKLFNHFVALIEQNSWEMNSVVLGKFYAMAAKLEVKKHNLGNALEYALTATKVNNSAGVKKLAKELAKKLEVTIDI